MQVNKTPYRTIFLEEFAKSSWDYFQQIGYPNSKNEEWRFSNPNPWILPNKFDANKKDDSLINYTTNKNTDDSLLIKIYDDNILIPKELPIGVEILDVFQAIEKKMLDGSIGSVADYHNSAFSAENMALFNNGILIYIHKNVRLDKPLQIVYEINNNVQLFPSFYLSIGENYSVEVLESEISGNDDKHYINSVFEVVAHNNSSINWTKFQNLNFNTAHISSFDLALEKNTRVNYNFYDFGAGFIRRDININFYEPGSTLDLNGLFSLSKKQHVDIFSKINHLAPECSSNQLVKGVLSDSSSGVFRGIANVKNQAKKTSANQLNHNLLLSPNAKINSIPILEIYEDDVQCSHGSTTGEIDQDAIYYLQTRGISRKDAIELIVKGFSDEVINKIQNNNFKNKIQNIILEKLNTFID